MASRDALLAALEAACRAGNPALQESILCALEGREFRLEDALPPLHPEIAEVIFPKHPN